MSRACRRQSRRRQFCPRTRAEHLAVPSYSWQLKFICWAACRSGCRDSQASVRGMRVGLFRDFLSGRELIHRGAQLGLGSRDPPRAWRDPARTSRGRRGVRTAEGQESGARIHIGRAGRREPIPGTWVWNQYGRLQRYHRVLGGCKQL